MQMLFPLVKRLAPGLDVNALAGELRERIADELDYEVEAQNHRAMARGWRGHPFVFVPPVDTQLSRRRMLVTEFMAGRRFEVVKALPDAERDRFGEIVFRFFFGTLNHLRRAAGDPHPGNYLLLEDGRVGFLDFGLMRVVDADYLAGERALAQAVIARRRGRPSTPASPRLGYLPNPDEFDPERLLGQLQMAGDVVPRAGLPPPHLGLRRRGHRGAAHRRARRTSSRCAAQTIPPQALLIRRMEGLVFADARRRCARAPTGTPSARSTGRTPRRARRWASRTRVLGPDPASAPYAARMLATALASVALLPGLLTPTVADVKQQTPLPILLPSLTTQSDRATLYGERRRRGATLPASRSAPCEDCSANACSRRVFSAHEGRQRRTARARSTLAKGRKGRYIPLSCGGSCSPPSISGRSAAWSTRSQTDATPRAARAGWRTRRSGRDRGKRLRAPRRTAPRPAAPGTARRPRRGAAIT